MASPETYTTLDESVGGTGRIAPSSYVVTGDPLIERIQQWLHSFAY